MSEAARRIRRFEHETVALVADELQLIPEGWVARTPSLPWVYDLNHVGVEGPIETDEALALVERHMRDLPYRHLVVEHEPSGERLADALRPEGWKIERDVVMAFAGEVDRSLDTSAVTEAEEAVALELMGEWFLDDEEMRNSAEMRRQVLEATRRTWRARNARHFGVLGPEGNLAGITMLFSDGSIAEVEDVYVTPAERGHGLARVLVTHAVVEALNGGHELVFIPADDDDWPKTIYAKVGFEPAARGVIFHRGA